MMYVGNNNPSEILPKKSHLYFLMTACNMARTNKLGLNKKNVKSKPPQEMEL